MIFVECNADEILIKTIINVPRKEIYHAGSKSRVCKRLQNQSNSKGLVDEDPRSSQPSYISKLQPGEDFSEFDIKVLLDNPNENQLIILCPRLEEWILKTAREADINAGTYNLPDNARKLHGNMDIRNFERFLEELKNKNPQRLRNLKRLLEK